MSHKPLLSVPSDFHRCQDETWEYVKSTAGYLSEREARFLMVAAALSPADGEILEIGSFKGRSTVALARVAKRYGLGNVIAVDPHTSPCETDPDLQGQSSTYQDFLGNLRRADVDDVVKPQRMFSRDYARQCNDRLRLLWIDGDHTLKGAREDLQLFKRHLQPGAIVAMHDVLGTFEGSLRVFCEDVLGSDDFGPAGFSGSIGWAQYLPGEGRRYRLSRRLLAFPARKLIPVAQSERGLVGWNKLRYKFWRPLAPHGDVNAARWLRRIVA